MKNASRQLVLVCWLLLAILSLLGMLYLCETDFAVKWADTELYAEYLLFYCLALWIAVTHMIPNWACDLLGKKETVPGGSLPTWVTALLTFGIILAFSYVVFSFF